MELVSRNMVQVEERRDCGRPTLCWMHDLLRELALSTSESENFCLVYEESVATEICRVHRPSIHADDQRGKAGEAFSSENGNALDFIGTGRRIIGKL
ncbi:hypothetical protein IFM89_006772 [Coptis chinensis]|uniref:Uncharacterized protein n=1 Tax=Coptis chinensis TaxID=261450 RepID=A0A835ICE5_9MAGN|nr:hypothetical protein IFM89_006772 [Coptis chinensis]